ncbi:MAG: flagellar export chaperone FliS [Treponema sp.]|nr:flagellar export chaperone FliS [Treponema sp.]
MAYNAVSSYKNTSVTTASPSQLLVILYDEAVRQLDIAIDLLDEYNKNGKKDPSKIEPTSKAVIKTQNIVTELIVSLDFDNGGEIAQNLFNLYTWFNSELTDANIKHDQQKITVVRNLISELRGTWSEISIKMAAEEKSRYVPSVDISY